MPDPNVADAFAVIADRVGGNGLYSSNAQVVVYKLVGEFDPREAISHGFIDSQQLPAWRSTNGSIGEFGGMPMSTIEGTYRENSMTLDTSRRHVIATNGPDKYLVSLAVTTSVDQVVAAGEATDAIVNGFKVSVPAPPGATPPAAPPPPRPRLPARRRPLPLWPTAPGAADHRTIRIRACSPGRSLAPGGTPITSHTAASYCVAHVHRRGALSVRRGRNRGARRMAADPAAVG